MTPSPLRFLRARRMALLAGVAAASTALGPPGRAEDQAGLAFLAEVNAVRTNAPAYAAHLEAGLRHYQGRMLLLPGRIPLETREGAGAVKEAIAVLRKTAPLVELAWSAGMGRAALAHARDLGTTGRVSHTGRDGISPFDRLNRFGEWQELAAENVAVGRHDARSALIAMLVDDGVGGRPHRENVLRARFRWLGAADAEHPRYGRVWVAVFAAGFDDAPDR